MQHFGTLHSVFFLRPRQKKVDLSRCQPTNSNSYGAGSLVHLAEYLKSYKLCQVCLSPVLEGKQVRLKDHHHHHHLTWPQC